MRASWRSWTYRPTATGAWSTCARGTTFLCALAPGNGSADASVTVVDVSGGSGKAAMLQHFGLGGIASHTAMGMAVLV
jgi:hypothetical protein